MDAINILLMQPLVDVQAHMMAYAMRNIPFIKDSYDDYGRQNMQSQLIEQLSDFLEDGIDCINEETIEFLEPYVELSPLDDDQLKFFRPDVLKSTSALLFHLCNWCLAMKDYHRAKSVNDYQKFDIHDKFHGIAEVQ